MDMSQIHTSQCDFNNFFILNFEIQLLIPPDNISTLYPEIFHVSGTFYEMRLLVLYLQTRNIVDLLREFGFGRHL
jgi:hypothetical protein